MDTRRSEVNSREGFETWLLLSPPMDRISRSEVNSREGFETKLPCKPLHRTHLVEVK